MHNKSLPPSDRPEGDDQPESRRTWIEYDTVTEATKDLPEFERETIRKFHRYYREKGLSLDDAAALLDRDGSSLSQIFRGKYTAKNTNFVNEMDWFLTLEEKRSVGSRAEFVETKLTRKIWAACDMALDFQKIVMVIGDSQIGKTTALKAYAHAHNHGKTIYTSMPAGGGISEYAVELADKVRVPTRMNVIPLRRAIIGKFNSRMLLITDEMHQCMNPTFGSRQMRCIEFIRELFDKAECGGVISATRVFAEAMEHGAAAKFFEQFKRRRVLILDLPDRPTQEDLNTFAKSFGLPPSSGPARELEAKVIDDEALGMWITVLRMGAKLAAGEKKPFEWSHVIAAHRGLKQMEGKRN